MSMKENVLSKSINRGGYSAMCIGNGQVHDAISPSDEISKTLNCMEDPMKVLIYRKKGHPQNSEQGQGWEETQVNDTLNAFDSTETRTPTIIQQTVYENHSQDTRYKELGDVCQPISATFGMGGNNQPFVVKEVFDASRRHNYEPFGDISGTVQAHFGTGGGNVPVVVEEPILLESNQNHATIRTDGVSTTLSASMGMDGGYVPMIERKEPETVVRRLTPLECERLQGYPDHWTDIGDWVDSKGKTHKGESDSPRYKALGNSIALPFWQYMAEKMVAQFDRPATMASLFDGIGGFPLVFSRCGCEPIWASEIEEFPIAVTKLRFPEKEE